MARHTSTTRCRYRSRQVCMSSRFRPCTTSHDRCVRRSHMTRTGPHDVDRGRHLTYIRATRRYQLDNASQIGCRQSERIRSALCASLPAGSAAGASLSVTEHGRHDMDAGMSSIWRPILGRRHDYNMQIISDSAASSSLVPFTGPEDAAGSRTFIPFNFHAKTRLDTSQPSLRLLQCGH